MTGTCLSAGCTERAVARGHCKRHYGALRRRGLLAGSQNCSFPGCRSPYEAKGYCRAHYLAIAAPARGACSVEGCGKPAHVRRLCAMHHARVKATGAALTWRERFARDHPPEDGVGLVPLRTGEVARVDAEDYPRVIEHRWYRNVSGGRAFVATTVGGHQVQLARFVLGVTGKGRVLFKDKDALNCRKQNLAVATAQQQHFNQRAGRRRGKSSRYKGVSRRRDTGRYTAYIDRDGARRRLGCFDTEAEAARAYDEAAGRLFGPFARLNFPDAPA